MQPAPRALLASLVTITLATPAAAQVALKVTTETNVSGTASCSWGPTKSFSISANTDVSQGFVKGASTSGMYIFTYAAASCESRLDVTHTSSLVQVKWREKSDGQGTGSGASYSAHTGYHNVIVVLSAPTPIAGTLTLETRSDLARLADARLDIDADGTSELVGTGTRQLHMDVVLGPTERRFRFRITTRISGSGSSLSTSPAEVSLRFEPGKGDLTTLGAPCRGPALATWYRAPENQTAGLFELRAGKVPAGQMALFAFGSSDPNFALPPFGCRLHTNVEAGVGVAVSNGMARLPIPVPASYSLPTGTKVYTQFLIVSGGGWVMSNGVMLTWK